MEPDLSTLGSHDHACLIYDDSDEMYEVIAPFLRHALEQGDRYMHVLHGTTREAFFAAMKQRGIDAESAVASGQLVVADATQTYLPDGHFDSTRMVRTLQQEDAAARKAAHPGLRATGEMEWWLTSPPGVDDIEAYEMALDAIFPTLSTHGICLYDARAFPPERLAGVLRTHAKVIYRGRVCDNPFYEPPRDEDDPPRDQDGTNGNLARQLRLMLEAQEARDLLARAEADLARARADIEELRRKWSGLARDEAGA